MKRKIVYLNTSVLGGCFDDEFKEDSLALMKHIKLGIYAGMISTTTEKELVGAPEHVRALVDEFDEDDLMRVSTSPAVAALAEAYLAAKVVPPNSKEDAAHIAFATVCGADVLASWNFKHIVNLRRIEDFNAVNLHEGYRAIEIRTPKELIDGNEEEGF